VRTLETAFPYVNLYTDPATAPQPYAGSRTIGFKNHAARTA